MPLATADVRPTTPDTPAEQDILGGSCPILPIQCCIIWAARQEKVISPLAFKVYFAAHEVKFWRFNTEPGETYHYEPYAFQLSDVGRLLPDVPVTKIAKAFGQLEATNILTLSDSGIWFAENLDDVTVDERAKKRTRAMFGQLHEKTRNKTMKIPRRLLKQLVECGRRIVRAATLMGLLLTTMLIKRADRYGGYTGCCKAKWIGKLFGVNASRVKSERAKWIEEGWFTREPTTPRARKKFGQWVRLNLSPSEPTPKTVENPALHTPTVQPQNPALDTPKVEPLSNADLSSSEEIDDHQVLIPEIPEILETPEPDADQTQLPIILAGTDSPKVQPQIPDFDPQVQPLLNRSLSSIEEIYNNQELTPQAPTPGAYQPQHPVKPTWVNIKPADLLNSTRSEELRQEAIQKGYLRATESDQINFFSAIAHALRVAKTNAGGLLRTVVEKGLWHVISQADEYNGIARLKRADDGQKPQEAQRTLDNPFLTTSANGIGQVDQQPIGLSKDALIVQTITADFQRADVKGHLFPLVQRHGYLQDWDQERWEQAEQELAQARLLRARQRHQEITMASIQDVIVEGANEDDPFFD